MKLYRLPCGCVGQQPRICTDKPNIIKMVRLFNCKSQQYGLEDLVTSHRPWTRLSPAAEAVALKQVQNLIEKGKAAA